jgi:nitroreductase
MMAPALGLGACWCGYYGLASDYSPFLKKLALPQGHKLLGAMLIGYPKYKYKHIPPRINPAIIWR